MAASVAFLHQAEYEATYNEYEEEAKRQFGLIREEERADGEDVPKREISTAQSGVAAEERKVVLQRSLLRGAGGGEEYDARKATAVANWLSAQEADSNAAGAAGRLPYRGVAQSLAPAHTRLQRHPQPEQHNPIRSRRRSVTLVAPSGLLAPAGASLRRSNSSSERTGLVHRLLHLHGTIDSLLPVYSPEELPRRAWDLLIMALVVWTAVTVPLSVSFGLPTSAEWEWGGYVVTALFAIDLAVNFRTAYHDHQVEASCTLLEMPSRGRLLALASVYDLVRLTSDLAELSQQATPERRLQLLQLAADVLEAAAPGSDVHVTAAVKAAGVARRVHGSGSALARHAELAAARSHLARYGRELLSEPALLRQLAATRRRLSTGAGLAVSMGVLAWMQQVGPG